MNKTKTTVERKLLTMTLAIALAFSSLCATPKKASAKAVSKVTKVVTLNKKNPWMFHMIKTDKKEKIVVKVKFLKIKGKKISAPKGLYYEFTSYWGKGGVMLKPKTYQEGKVVKAKPQAFNGYGEIDWSLYGDEYKGIKELKLKVTYQTKSGKKGIKSVKATRNEKDSKF